MIVLSASLVTIICLPSLLNSMPSVSGPAVISRTFSPNAKSTIETLAGVLSSSSSSSSSCFCSPGAGGLPLDEGSVDIKANPSLILTNSGLMPTSMVFSMTFVSTFTKLIEASSLFAVTRYFPSLVRPIPRGKPPTLNSSTTSIEFKSITVTPLFCEVTYTFPLSPWLHEDNINTTVNNFNQFITTPFLKCL